MTQLSRPWDGTTTLGDDGPYNAEKWTTTWGQLFGNDFAAASGGDNRGVIVGVENELRVVAESPASLNVTVKSGAALIKGRWYYNDADITLTPASNTSGSTRLDVVVLHADPSTQTIRAEIVQGSTTLPALTQSGNDWMIPLAYLSLSSPFASIAQSDIYDMRRWHNLGVLQGVTVQNKGAAALEAGDICAWDSANDKSVTDTSAVGQNVAGVVVGHIPINGWGQIVTKGVARVKTKNAISRGANLSASNTANRAGYCGGIPFAKAIEAGSADGHVLAHVDVAEVAGDWHKLEETYKASAPSGAVFLVGQTIGDTGSGATVASGQCRSLYVSLWDNLADAEAPVSTGRGANANADFDAGKTLTLPDIRGRVGLPADNMGGSAASVVTNTGADTIGANGGESTHTMTESELVPHTHTLAAQTQNTDLVSGSNFLQAGSGIVTGSTGSGTPFNVVQSFNTVHKYVRL